ncbi:RasGEF domain protein [Legionella nautarum]|uniref:RasGEF domain protein n=1 Tax=Legionella nautarum TaxID=45070 RepID=A0A0W0WV57_9GAMM|nr:RasGEF domain-containing protein [Legionella nautarum]KTD36148.1 RasGEF domain protein [Legionella nautarum]
MALDFLTWFKQNQTFLKESTASTFWDEQITEPRIQKAIVKKQKNRMFYAHIEAKIASDHAQLINYYLKDAFKKLNSSDFEKPEGFANKEKASFVLQNFHETRDKLAFLIKTDISQHRNRDSQINAFRRWITTAEILLKHRSYEGYFLVITLLMQIDTEQKLSIETPVVCQEIFNKLCNLTDPSLNFKALRDKIKNNKAPQDFTPIFIWSRDLTALNSAIEQARDTTNTLVQQIRRETGNNEGFSSEEKKDKILGEIRCEQQVPLSPIPTHLIAKYRTSEEKYFDNNLATLRELAIREQHQNLAMEQTDDAESSTLEIPETTEEILSSMEIPTSCELNEIDQNLGLITTEATNLDEMQLRTDSSKQPAAPSKLYAQLLPNFWKRGCSSEKAHWESLFSLSTECSI